MVPSGSITRAAIASTAPARYSARGNAEDGCRLSNRRITSPAASSDDPSAIASMIDGYRPQYPAAWSAPVTANAATAVRPAPTQENPNRSACFRTSDAARSTAHHVPSAHTVCQLVPCHTAT